MAGTFIGKYDTTSANNTSTGTDSVSVAEGMLPSTINNALRSIMADIRQWYNDGQWIEYGDSAGTYTATYASATSFTIDGVDVTSVYHANRRIKLIASTPGTIYGTISSTSFSTNTTVNVTWDSGSLSNEAITSVYVGILSKTNDAIPTGIDAAKIADGTVSDTEFQYLNGVTSAVQTQLDAKLVKANNLSDLTNAGTARTNLGVAIGSDVQAYDADLAAIAGLTSAADKGIQFTGSGTAATYDLTSAGKAILDDANASAQRTTLGVAIGSDVQAYHANLADVAGLANTDGNFIVGDGSNFVAENGSTARTSLGLGSIATQASTNVSITGGSISGLSDPSTNSEAATKNYVDQAVAGLRTRIVAEVATTANVDLTADLQNGDTIDGVTLVTGDRVLVKDQSTGSQNGLYTVVASGTASRDTEYDTIAELSGQMVVVNQGTTNDDKIFLCTTNNTATLDSDTITFTQVTPSNSGTVTSIGIADSGAGEFTVTNSPITSAGNISLAVNEIAHNKMAALTASRALESNGSGVVTASAVTSTELGYLDGVTSAIQTQINGKLANVSEDSTPQLGGNLDVNGNNIVSASNGDINIVPNGTGVVSVQGTMNPSISSTGKTLVFGF